MPHPPVRTGGFTGDLFAVRVARRPRPGRSAHPRGRATRTAAGYAEIILRVGSAVSIPSIAPPEGWEPHSLHSAKYRSYGDGVRNVGLLEAWRLWSEGKSLTDYELWGLSILWWGRAGKVIQFLGGLTILLDLLGPERLRRWGQGMAKGPFRKIAARSADSAVMETLCLIVAAAIAVWLDDYLGAPARWLQAVEGQIPDAWVWVFLVVLGGSIWLAVVTNKAASTIRRWSRRAAITVAVAGGALSVTYLLAYLLTDLLRFVPIVGAVIAIWWGLLIALEWVVARPVAWVLDRQAPGQPVRWFGVVLVVVGFHFDLLSS